MKIATLYGNEDDTRLAIWCPGCNDLHGPCVKGPNAWQWNGSLEKPTLSPSILINKDKPESRCHSFVKEGKIQFLNDCFHELKGQTVPLPELPEWV